MKTDKELDIALIEKVKKGDIPAFRQLVDKYKDVSLSLACSILKDKARAEDVLQEVFIKVYRKAHTFRQQSAFSSWLFRIVVNSSYNELKRHKVNSNAGSIFPYISVDNEKTVFENLREEEQKKFVILALNNIKPDEALVLRLFYLCEYSLKEIAVITGFSIAKIKVDLHRGRNNMEKVLKDLLGKQIFDLY